MAEPESTNDLILSVSIMPPGLNRNRLSKTFGESGQGRQIYRVRDCSFAIMLQQFLIDYQKYPIPRVRHHVNPQSYLAAADQQKLPSLYPPVITQAKWEQWFTDIHQPLVLDIGSGRGGFLLNHAWHFPEKNVLGVEIRNILVEWTMRVISGEQFTNAHVLWYSAANGFSWIPNSSVEYATYLFADPWPKKRHHKRRAFSSPFLTDLQRVLVPHGKLYLATDRADVAEQQAAMLEEHQGFHLAELHPDDWPFSFETDQQNFCRRKNIPYRLFCATANANND